MVTARSHGARALFLSLAVLCALPALAAPDVSSPASRSGSLVVGGLTRTYHLFVPPAAAAAETAPLVVVLHGGYGTGLFAEGAYHWDEAAQRGGFLVVYPDGLNRAWNAGTCCGVPHRDNVDDVAFLSALVRLLVHDERADPHRIYVTGMSNGAAMAYRMACDAPFAIAAIGPVAGTLFGSCAHPQATSVLAIHGLADKNIPFAGGDGGRNVGVVPSVASTLAVWTVQDRCGAPSAHTGGAVATQSWVCADGRVVDLITIADAGHQWPGGRPSSPQTERAAAIIGLHLETPSTELDATSALSAFFARHSAPTSATH